jgi:hypothetical protein
MRVRAVLLLLTAAAFAVGPLASPAYAATSVGCAGTLTSVNPDNTPLDRVAIPSSGGTDARPFQIMWAGTTTWQGELGQTTAEGIWRVTVEKPSWLFALGELATSHLHGISGTFVTEPGNTTLSGIFVPNTIEPVALPGDYQVGISVAGSGGISCVGTVSVRVLDSPGRTPMWWLAFLLVIAGLAMFFVFGLSKWTKPIRTRPDE